MNETTSIAPETRHDFVQILDAAHLLALDGRIVEPIRCVPEGHKIVGHNAWSAPDVVGLNTTRAIMAELRERAPLPVERLIALAIEAGHLDPISWRIHAAIPCAPHKTAFVGRHIVELARQATREELHTMCDRLRRNAPANDTAPHLYILMRTDTAGPTFTEAIACAARVPVHAFYADSCDIRVLAANSAADLETRISTAARCGLPVGAIVNGMSSLACVWLVASPAEAIPVIAGLHPNPSC